MQNPGVPQDCPEIIPEKTAFGKPDSGGSGQNGLIPLRLLQMTDDRSADRRDNGGTFALSLGVGVMSKRALSKRRWHDRGGYLERVIAVLDTMPQEMRYWVVEGINGLAEKNWKVDDLLKSVGTEKILALYKSRNKRRGYDVDPKLYKTINYFFLLPDDQQEELARKSLEFVRTMAEFAANCNEHMMTPKRDELQRLVDLFVLSGPEEVQVQIRRKHPEFKFTHEVVQDEEKGMRIQITEKPAES